MGVWSKEFSTWWSGIGSSQPVYFLYEVTYTPDAASRTCEVYADLYVKTGPSGPGEGTYARDPKINVNSFFAVGHDDNLKTEKYYYDYYSVRVWDGYLHFSGTGKVYIPYDATGHASCRFWSNLTAFNDQGDYPHPDISCVADEWFALPEITPLDLGSTVYINGEAYTPYINGSKCDAYINGVKY